MTTFSLKHFHVSYKTTDWSGKTVTESTKVYAEDAAMAKKKVLALHPSIYEAVQTYDLGN